MPADKKLNKLVLRGECLSMKCCYFVFVICILLIISSPNIVLASMSNQAIFVVDSQSYSVNGIVYQMNTAPYLEQNRVFIPLRYLAHALGLDEKNIIQDDCGKSIELYSADKKIKLFFNNYTFYVNDKGYQMDVAPIIKDKHIFLPARQVVETLGYSVGWDEKARAVLIGLPGNLPDIKSLPPTFLPVKVRSCQFSDSDLWLSQKLSSISILFNGEYANVYNAGVAAKYVNGFILEPGREFSFNKVVGERTEQRGFITGFDILDNLTVGGGVCRTSTVLFQAAREAGLDILERHPHYRPVHYTPPGTDASVSWGWMDLRFKNNRQNPIVIYSGLNEEEKGRRLWAELYERKPLTKVDVAVLIKAPGSNLWENIEKTRLVALLKDSVSFVSLEQLGDLLLLSPEIKEQEGAVTATININNQLINFYEGNKKFTINGVEFALKEAPFCLPGCNCKFWLPLRDWARLTGAEVLWIDRSPPLILLNLSGVDVAERKEM